MSKRQELRERRARQKKTQRILLISGGLIVVAAIAMFFIATAMQPLGDVDAPAPITRSQVNFNTMGDPNAPVKIIEYSNFLCSHCAEFATETEHLIIRDYVETGKVFFEYRTIGGGDSEAGRTAEAAYCAGDQGKFWEMHDYIFANFKYLDFSDRRLLAFAEKIGLEMNQFKDCFNNRKYTGRVQEDALNSQKDGVQGTPAFILSNGDVIGGNAPYAEFQAKIDAALAAAGQ